MNYWESMPDIYKGMNTGERLWNGCISGISLFAAILIVLCICALTGCTTTRYVKVPETHTDTLYISKMQRDSIWLHDSIHVTERQQGDTFYVEVAKWKTKHIERLQTDTLIEHHTDSVPVPYPVEVKVPSELTWWQKTLQRTGGIALILLLVWIGRTAWKIYTKRF